MNSNSILYCVYTATWNCASTVPAWLGTISSGSVNITKACQHCAEPSRAMLAQLALIKRAVTELARLGTFSPVSVNDTEPNPCCSRAVPSTELVRFSPKNAWQWYLDSCDCVAAFRVFLCLPVRFFCRQSRPQTMPSKDHKSIAIINHYHVMRLPDVPPFKLKIDRTWTTLIIAVTLPVSGQHGAIFSTVPLWLGFQWQCKRSINVTVLQHFLNDAMQYKQPSLLWTMFKGRKEQEEEWKDRL